MSPLWIVWQTTKTQVWSHKKHYNRSLVQDNKGRWNISHFSTLETRTLSIIPILCLRVNRGRSITNLSMWMTRCFYICLVIQLSSPRGSLVIWLHRCSANLPQIHNYHHVHNNLINIFTKGCTYITSTWTKCTRHESFDWESILEVGTYLEVERTIEKCSEFTLGAPPPPSPRLPLTLRLLQREWRHNDRHYIPPYSPLD